MKLLEPERIYSTAQLVEALQSGLVGLKEQLHVLSILDGSASSWPGLSTALSDLESLVDLTVKHSMQLDSSKQQLEAGKGQLLAQVADLTSTVASANSARQELQYQLDKEQQAGRQLQRKLDASDLELERTKRQVWDMEKTRADLAQQVEKQRTDAEFMEGEISGLKEQVASQNEQLSILREDFAVKSGELAHTSASLQERKEAMAQLKNQLSAQLQQNKQQLEAAYQQLKTAQESAAAQLKQVQDTLQSQMKQLQAELVATMEAKQLAQETVGKLQQEVATLSAELNKSQTEAAFLKEWQDVVKRMADDKVKEAQSEVQAEKEQAAQAAAAAAGQLQGLQEKLQQQETNATTLQRQIALMQAQLREAQRAGAAAAEAQATASKAIQAQAAEIAALRQQLKAAELLVERAKADHSAAEAALREAAAAEVADLKGKLSEVTREAAVGRAMIEGWQRDNKAMQEKIVHLEQAVAAAKADTQAAYQAAKEEQGRTAAQAAAQEAAMHDLRVQLEDHKREVQRSRIEAASLTKQYEQALKRLRREADAGAEEVRRLLETQASTGLATTAPAATSSILATTQHIVSQQQQFDGGGGSLKLPAAAGATGCGGVGLVTAASTESEVPAHIQRELAQLRQHMHTVSGNLQAADAAMQIMAAAQRSKQSSPLVSTAAAGCTAVISGAASQPATVAVQPVCNKNMPALSGIFQQTAAAAAAGQYDMQAAAPALVAAAPATSTAAAHTSPGASNVATVTNQASQPPGESSPRRLHGQAAVANASIPEKEASSSSVAAAAVQKADGVPSKQGGYAAVSTSKKTFNTGTCTKPAAGATLTKAKAGGHPVAAVAKQQAVSAASTNAAEPASGCTSAAEAVAESVASRPAAAKSACQGQPKRPTAATSSKTLLKPTVRSSTTAATMPVHAGSADQAAAVAAVLAEHAPSDLDGGTSTCNTKVLNTTTGSIAATTGPRKSQAAGSSTVVKGAALHGHAEASTAAASTSAKHAAAAVLNATSTGAAKPAAKWVTPAAGVSKATTLKRGALTAQKSQSAVLVTKTQESGTDP